MKIIKTIAELRLLIKDCKSLGKKIGLVPTMGSLHAGHGSLIKKAREFTDIVVVSVFVNTLQFNSATDLANYPRNLDKDARFCEDYAVDVIFAPDTTEMYPHGGLHIKVIPSHLDINLCGRTRPGHFIGVCSVVAKLFNIVTPDYAFFGQKDIQQLRIVEKMVEDLNFAVQIVPCETCRTADALALSSRNALLTQDELKLSLIVPTLLNHMLDMIKSGERDVAIIIHEAIKLVPEDKLLKIDYIEIVRYEDLQKLEIVQGKFILACAIFVGQVKLIDNLIYEL